MGRRLVESATDLMVSYVKSNIAAALTAVRVDADTVRNVGVATPIFQEYFIARNYAALKPPSLFVVCDDVDFKKPERGANFIDGTMHFTFAAISTGQTNEIVARATWRYQAALSQILDNARLTSADEAFKIVIIVRTAEFSEEYDVSTQNTAAKSWRKEVHLKCDVEFWEAL